jgi:methylmalonyl-CoA mutase C-terminal domain/subunit
LPAVVQALAARGGSEIKVFGGGIIPQDDIPALTAAGVAQVFLPGTPLEEIVKWVKENISPKAVRG